MSIQDAVHKLYEQRGSFIIVGLTGRTGSGCTTTANLLTKPFNELGLSHPGLAPDTPDQRKYRITYEYANRNWRPFYRISVTSVIASFLAEETPDDVATFAVGEKYLPASERQAFARSLTPLFAKWKTVSKYLGQGNQSNQQELEWLFSCLDEELAQIVLLIKKTLRTQASGFLQKIGDVIRRSGRALGESEVAEYFYALPRRCEQLIVRRNRLDELRKVSRTYIVLDALRNPFEAYYFSERFANFYLIAVTTENETRIRRLAREKLNEDQIAELDDKEYPERNDPLEGYDQFVSQNIQACLQAADIFLHNPGYSADGRQEDVTDLVGQLVHYVSLMQHPGIVTPTRIERCMQIAFSARANSGCISRQVGAVVADEDYSIKAVGWNDVPAGQVPCLLRNINDVLVPQDKEAYSDFELQDIDFRKHLKTSYINIAAAPLNGRNPSFCFRTEYNTHTGEKNQVHTRSLHAEENAILQIAKYGGDALRKGVLFSTASPCELCAKKAYQLGIRDVFYIDPYPGISLDHVLRSGKSETRPRMHLFQGAIGQAYHRLYSRIRPYKDELRALIAPIPVDKDLAPKEKTAPDLFEIPPKPRRASKRR